MPVSPGRATDARFFPPLVRVMRSVVVRPLTSLWDLVAPPSVVETRRAVSVSSEGPMVKLDNDAIGAPTHDRSGERT